MQYSSQDVRASTMAISESIKYRKNCLIEASPSKFNQQRQLFLDQSNIQPLFDKHSKSLNPSVQAKKESRRKAGSIVKIVRNFKSNEKDEQVLTRKQLGDGSNYLNSKLQCDRNNDESIGVYKKLYEQNKVLNEALKTKIYQSNEKPQFANPLIGLSNYSYHGQENQFSRKIYTPSEEALRSNDKRQQNVLNSKYQKMLEDYDKKKNFIKEEMQAMKQKNSLQNFSTYDRNLNQQNLAPQTANNFYKEPAAEKSKYQTLDQKLKNIQGNFNVGLKGSLSDKKDHFNNNSIEFKLKDAKQNDKEDEIDRKFKAYQSKLQKHKDFEKRNPSMSRKEVHQPSVEKLAGKNLASSTKTQFFSSKNQGNETLKIFIDLMIKQIQKDEDVRVLKQNLKGVEIKQIQGILKQKFGVSQYPQNFKLSTQEYDPFFEIQKSQVSVQQTVRKLIGAIEIADNFWENLVRRRLSKSDLEQVFDIVNYGKRDEIGMNELARQLSFHMGKTVRNKEIYLIHQRLTPLTRQNFVSKLQAETK